MVRDNDGANPSRRRFLKATGAAALTAGLAGCQGTPEDNTTTSSSDGTTTTSTTTSGSSEFTGHDSYPYYPNETRVDMAKKVMEEAGYGPDNRYDLSWLQYSSGAWKEMANTIRARLSSAYIDMSISEAGFGSLLSKTKNGEHEAYTLGWIADYPQPQNFVQLFDPPNTVYDAEGATPNGARLFWSEDAKARPEVRKFMIEQFDKIENNADNSDEAAQIRADAAKKMEEGNWEAAGLIPVYHSVSEAFWYDNVDYDPSGGMGGSRAKSNRSVSSLSGKNTLNLMSGTFNTLDPIASGNTASGNVIMDVCDAPLNYANGTTEVENLLVESYTVSDDLTKYNFKLKEGVQFHGDYGELTAADVVYSFRRLIESKNSTNTYFPISVMGIKHKKDGEDITEATGVKQVSKYEFSIEMEKPFAYALSVLCYGAFSIVPEGIVGDISGYEGDMSYTEFSSSNLISCGPFTFDSWESGNGGEVVVNTFSDYHGTPASFDTVHRAILTEDSAVYNYFLNNQADIGGIPTSYYDPSKISIEKQLSGGREVGTYGPMDDGDTVNYSKTPTIDTFYIGFNMEKVPKAVRQAMAYVINHEQFISNVFKNRGASAFHLQPPQIFAGGADGYAKHWQGK